MSNSRQYDIGFFSSADRGLDVLLAMIPEIEKRLGRKVTSTWAYGWNTYDKFHAQNPQKMKWKWQVIKAMNETSMVTQGRLSHEDLAKLMMNTKVHAYPVSFPEIDCITVKKTQLAKCKIITSGYAALQESVMQNEPEIELIHEKPKELDKFIDRVVAALKEPRNEKELESTKQEVLDRWRWEKVAQVWDKALS